MMVIMSQNKEDLFNFDNMFKLGIEKEYGANSANPCFSIRATVDKGDRYLLGIYKTEERCKDILRDIGLHNCSDCGKYVIYTMPEE